MAFRRSLIVGIVGLAAAATGAIVACGGEGFDPQSRVDSVRLFAVRADKPYAKPGETVTLETLMTDGRNVKPRPLKLYWIPVLCLNPKDDAYYQCFIPGNGETSGATLIPVGALASAAADAGVAADAGASAGAASGAQVGNPLASIPTGVDIGAFLPQGPTFSFQMPQNAVKAREGIAPYGLVVIFNVACAGTIQFADRNPTAGPQQVPVLCTDEAGNKLAPSDYVIAISRVYSYTDQTNANPVIDKVTFDGADVDLAAGITMDRCTTEKSADCPEHKLDVVVPESSWQLNPTNEPGSPSEGLREQIWVDYYSDRSNLDSDARLLYDTKKGRVPESEVKIRAFPDPGNGSVWMVVHDNRGGAAWIIVPLHVK